MSRIRGKDTSIELRLRKALWKEGLRFRKHYKKAPGTPDVALVGTKVAIFCDSTFWHGYDWDDRKQALKSNRDFWIKKIERNIQRDQDVNEKLSNEGWVVLRFWDFEINKKIEDVIKQITEVHNLRKKETGFSNA